MAGKKSDKKNHKSHWPLLKLGHSILTTSLLQSWVYVVLFTAWATCIAFICHKVHDLSFESTLLGVFGTILGFIISFRTSTAFERYNEGKKLLSTIAYASRTFARIVWFHVPLEIVSPTSGSTQQNLVTILYKSKTPSEILKEKHTALDLIEAFSIAVKHHLREIGVKQEVWERTGGDTVKERPRLQNTHSSWASDATAASPNDIVIEVRSEGKNEQEQLEDEKQSDMIPGGGTNLSARNIPLEISCCLSSYIVALQQQGVDGSVTNNLIVALNQLVQSFTDLEKVSADQIPFSYRFQLWTSAYLYIFFLPFQLWKTLKYISIPGTSLAALIFLGLLSAGEEIENPFNDDLNDLDMEGFCNDLGEELKTLMSTSISTSQSERGDLGVRINDVLECLRGKERGEASAGRRKTWLWRKWERAGKH